MLCLSQLIHSSSLLPTSFYTESLTPPLFIPTNPLSPIDSKSASMAFKSVPTKQLGELLQEQQDPFVLEIYLLEKGYLRTNFNSETSFHCCSGNASSLLKTSTSWGINKKRIVIPNCSKIVNAVFNKLLSIRNSRKLKNSVSEYSKNSQETAETDRFSSASSSTVFNSCSDQSDIEDKQSNSPTQKDIGDTSLAFKFGIHFLEKEVITDRKFQWRCREDTEELSLVSVLEETPSDEGSFSPVHDNGRHISRSDLSSQHLTAKRVLQPSKQTRAWRNRGNQQFVEFSGPEELGKVTFEDMRTWSKLSGNETNTTKVMYMDFKAFAAEWSGFEQQMREIGAEIGDAILEDIIGKEIVVGIIELVEPQL